MVSFDLSTTNMILTVAVAGLFIFFITLLIKLNPSTEKKEKLENRILVERQKPVQTSHSLPQNPPPTKIDAQRIEVPKAVQKPPLAISATVGGESVPTKHATQAPTPTFWERRETPQLPEKSGAQTKTEAFPTRKDCLHNFGYLRTFPKNSPIPDECFGCEKIVDCLVNNKKSIGKTKG